MSELLRTLIIEDRPADAKKVVRELERAGFDPEWHRVETEKQYEDQLDTTPDVILADYTLPKFNAMRALEVLQKKGLDIPFIIFSGTVGEERANDALRHGAADYLCKDRLERLGRAVNSALEQHRARKETRRAAAELRSTHVQLQHLLAHSPAVIYILKIEGKQIVPVLVSHNIERLLGVTAAESARAGWWAESLHPEDRKFVLQRQQESLSGDGYSMEYRIQHRDGSYHWVEDNNSVVRDANGTATEAVGVWTDITERKQAAGVLQESERRFRDMLKNASLIALIVDKAGRVDFCNDYFLRLTGWKSDEVIGSDWFSMFIPKSDTTVRQLFFETIAAGTFPAHYENPIQTRTGSLREIAWNNTVLRDTAGDSIGLASLGEDVTERNQAEARVREQANIINGAHDAIIIRNFGDDLITFWNRGAERVYGWSAQEAEGKRTGQSLFASPADRAEALKILMTTGEFFGETRQVTKDGRKIMVDSRASLIRDNEGKPRSILFISTDITRRRQTEDALNTLRRQYELILQSLGEGIHGIGPDGTIIFENVAAARMLGTRVNDLVGKQAHETIHHSHQDGSAYAKEECPMYQTLRDGVVRHRSDECFWRADGTYFPVDYVSAPLRDERGGIAGCVVTFRDITERKEAEEALQHQEKQYQILFETHPNPTWVYDEQTLAFLAVNDAAIEHYGYSREEFLKMSIRDIRPPEDVLAMLKASESRATRSPDEQSRFGGTWRHCKKNGQEIRADLYTTRIEFEGRAAHLAIAIDVTEKKKAEDAIRGSEERMRAILESALDCIITIDHHGRVLEFNPAAEKTFGYTRESAIGQLLAELIIPPLLRDDHARGLAHYLSSGAGPILGKRIEMTGMRHDHTEFPVELALTRIGTQDPPMFTGFIRDITQRKQAEERLVEQGDIINRAHDAIIVLNFKDQRITFWNNGAERLYGWNASDALGRSLGELTFAEAGDGEGPLQTLAAAGEFHGEIKQLARDGREIIVDCRATLVRHPDGTPRSALFINTDVTEQKKLETHLLRAQRLESIGTLASGVAHDLNNILAPILMCAEVLKSSPNREDLPALVSLIEESAKRGTNVVKQVLTFARGIEGERVVIKPAHLIQEMVDIAQKTFPKSIEIVARYSDNLHSIKCDPTQLHQVLLNLSVNARDAMPNGGLLTIRAENFEVDEHYATMTPGANLGPHVMLGVTDSGVGMSRATIDKIFDPFYTTKEVGKGTGLGLSTALGIVKSHNGLLSVYSQIGSGTTFKILLPAEASEEEIRQSELSFESLGGHGELILLVDDEPGILRITQIILEKHNYRILCAKDGPEALAAVAQEKERISVVLTDLSMPYMDGMALVRTIKKMKPEIRFIASTGQEDTRVAGLEALGVRHFLTKPYDTKTLLTTVHDTLVAAPSP